MERNNRQTPTLFQTTHHLRQNRFYLFELAVNKDANCLEGARRRVLPPLTSTDVLRHELRQLAGCIDRTFCPLRNNGARNLATKPLFTIILDNLVQILFRCCCNPLCGRHSARRIHAHIQRCIKTETETPCAVIYLRGRNPQIKQRTIYLFNTQLIQGRLKT